MASGRLVPISISNTVVVAFARNAFDRDADRSQIVGKGGVVDLKVNEVANPMGESFM